MRPPLVIGEYTILFVINVVLFIIFLFGTSSPFANW